MWISYFKYAGFVPNATLHVYKNEKRQKAVDLAAAVQIATTNIIEGAFKVKLTWDEIEGKNIQLKVTVDQQEEILNWNFSSFTHVEEFVLAHNLVLKGTYTNITSL